MRESFGARLRRHREQRNVSLAEIAEQTKIKASLLEGLERDDISQWPSGIFRRAYVRSYAAAIGFDPDAAVREFIALNPDPVDVAETTPAPATGLRGLFGSFRRRAPVGIAQNPTPASPSPPPASAETATATVGKRPADVVSDPETAPVEAAPDPPPQLRSSEVPRRSVDVKRALDASTNSDAPAARTATVNAAPVSSAASEKRTTDLLAAARICTELGRVDDAEQVLPLLGEAARVLGARGLIVWVWDSAMEELEPALVHGYPARVRARLRGVKATADNVTAAAYRAGAPLATSGALAIPLLAPAACAGVLAIETESGREQDPEVRAVATFFAAMLAQLIGGVAADVAVPATEPAHDAASGSASARVG